MIPIDSSPFSAKVTPLIHEISPRTMNKHVIPFIKKNQMYFYLIFIIAFLVGVFLAPYWFTRISENGIYFDSNTGAIGDTIGGITAPFLSALGSILLFITIWVQIDTNKRQHKRDTFERQISSFTHDYDNLRSDVNNFPCTDDTQLRGSAAINHYAKKISQTTIDSEIDQYLDTMEYFQLINLLYSIGVITIDILESNLPLLTRFSLIGKMKRLYDGYLSYHASNIADILNDIELQSDHVRLFLDSRKCADEAFETAQDFKDLNEIK